VAGPITVSRAWECEEAIQFARPHPAGPFWVELQRGPGVVPWQGVPLAIFTQNVIGPFSSRSSSLRAASWTRCGAECC